jgi:hypothetical protein
MAYSIQRCITRKFVCTLRYTFKKSQLIERQPVSSCKNNVSPRRSLIELARIHISGKLSQRPFHYSYSCWLCVIWVSYHGLWSDVESHDTRGHDLYVTVAYLGRDYSQLPTDMKLNDLQILSYMLKKPTRVDASVPAADCIATIARGITVSTVIAAIILLFIHAFMISRSLIVDGCDFWHLRVPASFEGTGSYSWVLKQCWRRP